MDPEDEGACADDEGAGDVETVPEAEEVNPEVEACVPEDEGAVVDDEVACAEDEEVIPEDVEAVPEDEGAVAEDDPIEELLEIVLGAVDEAVVEVPGELFGTVEVLKVELFATGEEVAVAVATVDKPKDA